MNKEYYNISISSRLYCRTLMKNSKKTLAITAADVITSVCWSVRHCACQLDYS